MRSLITGGAGYIGSMLASTLLAAGDHVVVVDDLLFGGDSLLSFLGHPRFSFQKLDVSRHDLDPLLDGVDIVYHLAAIVGFPACQEMGEDAARRVNVDATRRVFEAADRMEVERFVFASTYSVYGLATDDRPVTEESPLRPQSLYAQTKIEAEQYLESCRASRCATTIPRFTTLFGISPRTRFDLMVNQFILEALRDRRLVLVQGKNRRSFMHVNDAVRALVLLASSPVELVRGQTFNVGHENGNHTKAEIVERIRVAIPGVDVEHRDEFGGDMRDVMVDCAKISRQLGFRAQVGIDDGIREVRDAISSGLIKDATSARHRNHSVIVH